MKKFIYDKQVEEYSKENKEELIQRILSLQEIECKDRSFANHCKAGDSCYNINLLFDEIEKIQKNTQNSNITLSELNKQISDLLFIANDAKSSWQYIKDGLQEMNNSSRTACELIKLKEEITELETDQVENNSDYIDIDMQLWEER